MEIGISNQFRYKGYYCDYETGLFMVGHRYYNPEWVRWIQPDDIEYLDPTNINGLKLYAYCGNNPVNKYDPSGHSAIAIILAIVGIVASGVFTGMERFIETLGISPLGFGISAYFTYLSFPSFNKLRR